MTTNYKGKWLLHCHHETLCEPATEPIETRIAYIKAEKPKREQTVRLTAIRYLTKNEVLALPREYRATLEKYEVVWDKYKAELGKYNAVVEKRKAALEKCKAVEEKRKAALEKCKAVEEKRATELMAWHKAVCSPDCPWDGKTLFPNR